MMTMFYQLTRFSNMPNDAKDRVRDLPACDVHPVYGVVYGHPLQRHRNKRTTIGKAKNHCKLLCVFSRLEEGGQSLVREKGDILCNARQRCSEYNLSGSSFLPISLQYLNIIRNNAEKEYVQNPTFTISKQIIGREMHQGREEELESKGDLDQTKIYFNYICFSFAASAAMAFSCKSSFAVFGGRVISSFCFSVIDFALHL